MYEEYVSFLTFFLFFFSPSAVLAAALEVFFAAFAPSAADLAGALEAVEAGALPAVDAGLGAMGDLDGWLRWLDEGERRKGWGGCGGEKQG